MVGQPISTLCAAEQADEMRLILDSIRRGERVTRLETTRLRKGGTTIFVSVTVSPIYDEGGRLVGASSIARDMTAQHQLRAASDLRRADARFRGLIDAAPDAMVCVDGGGRITLVNAQTERLFGYRRAELEGHLVELLVPDAARAVHPGHRTGYMGEPVRRPMGAGQQLSGRRRDGSTFPAEISLSAIGTDEGTIVTAAVRDVSDQRRHQDDLERANRNLESFAYTVAHDLRTPLRALAGYSAALLDECGEGLGGAGRGYAGRIQAASEQRGRLIDDLLHLARVSRAEIHLRPVDLGAEAAGIAAELKRGEPDRRVRFVIERPVWAQADGSLARMALQSLLGNAWKFTSRRDEAVIEFGTVPGGAADGGDGRVCCFVRDNGAGFDPAYADKLFRPFQRLHAAREFAGTGVGLASVKQIVERHGGQVWARGAVGKGATFYFTLDAKGAR
jgi:PAS domain S-box-containing protein